MRKSRPDAQETERRWPWAVTGTVADANGKPVQGATVGKSGYVEKNLASQGDLYMADKMPEEDSRWDRKKIVLPGKPYHLDFTMVPAATIEGRLLDEKGKPMADKFIYLRGDKPSPSTSVAASTHSDAKGHFRFTPGYVRWIELPHEKGLAISRTQSLTLKPGKHDVVVRIASKEGTGKVPQIDSTKAD